MPDPVRVKFKPKEEVLAKLQGWYDFLASERALETASEEGALMPDGSIYTGLSPDTGERLFAMPQDASVTMSFNEAAKYVAELNRNKFLGHDDWRLPSISELKILFGLQNTKDLSGTFNHQSRRPFNTSGLYWSSSLPNGPIASNNIHCLRFNGTGTSQLYYPDALLSVRCVR